MDEDNQVVKYDLQNSNEDSARRKISMKMSQEEDGNLEKWKEFKNKSLLEVLNNNKRYEQSDSINEELSLSMPNQLKSNNVKQMFKTNAFS